MTTAQATAAERFHRLHDEPLLVVPNAWDVASARIVEDCGASAVATTSAGVAWSYGAADGDQIAREPVVDLVRRVAAAVDVPVSADIESGFADDEDRLAETIRLVLEAGAVGINIEDSLAGDDARGDRLRPADEQARRLTAVRTAADAAGVPLYVNARLDTYLFAVGEPGGRFDETVRRAEAYLAAGASGIFVPGVADLVLIERLVGAIPAPLNILVGPGSPTLPQLAEVGVRRASAGSAIAQAVYGHVRRATAELLGPGTYDELADPLDYASLNALVGAGG
jgi:2-methylisocitrate lyase-like PEP mutase family enzyme